MIARRTDEDELLEILSESIDGVRMRERATLERLLDANARRVVLVGKGSAGTRAQTCLRSLGVEPLAFADNDPSAWGTSIGGTPVMRPEEAANAFGDDALFIVTIWNAAHRFAQTATRLTDLGVRKVVPMSSVQWRFPETFLPFFSLDLPHNVYRERHDVIQAGTLWADDRSRAEYVAHVRWRARGDFGALPARVSEMQYFPDFFDLEPNEAFVDCGAYDGDTLREFLKRNRGEFRRVLALEPSPSTYRALQERIAALPPDVRERIAAEPFAVGERSETVHFDSAGDGDGRDAKVSAAGTFEVEARTLDTLCADRPATYIKMDIEGAEGPALAGARATIVRDRPILAICVYHRQTDLWRLPLFVHDLVPEYRMYLRSHENDGWETVVYAVPPERAIPEGRHYAR